MAAGLGGVTMGNPGVYIVILESGRGVLKFSIDPDGESYVSQIRFEERAGIEYTDTPGRTWLDRPPLVSVGEPLRVRQDGKKADLGTVAHTDATITGFTTIVRVLTDAGYDVTLTDCWRGWFAEIYGTPIQKLEKVGPVTHRLRDITRCQEGVPIDLDTVGGTAIQGVAQRIMRVDSSIPNILAQRLATQFIGLP